jgi:hypothetical protein
MLIKEDCMSLPAAAAAGAVWAKADEMNIIELQKLKKNDSYLFNISVIKQASRRLYAGHKTLLKPLPQTHQSLDLTSSELTSVGI